MRRQGIVLYELDAHMEVLLELIRRHCTASVHKVNAAPVSISPSSLSALGTLSLMALGLSLGVLVLPQHCSSLTCLEIELHSGRESGHFAGSLSIYHRKQAWTNSESVLPKCLSVTPGVRERILVHVTYTRGSSIRA
jgi:hypothetical protein